MNIATQRERGNNGRGRTEKKVRAPSQVIEGPRAMQVGLALWLAPHNWATQFSSVGAAYCQREA